MAGLWKRIAAAGIAVAAAQGSCAASPSPSPPAHVLSINMCADQLLVLLADRAQIAGVTRLSRDRETSLVADSASRLPVTDGSAEAVLAAAPDLLLLDSYQEAPLRRLFGGRAPRMLAVPPAESFAAVIANVRAVAAAVGHPERGERLIAAMRGAAPPREEPRPLAAYWQRRGYLTGPGTLVDEILTRAGFDNLARRLGRPALSQLSLEEILLARPQVLIVESGTHRVSDEGSALLHHPALAGIPRISLPDRWTTCGTPAVALAVHRLAAQRRALGL